MGDYAPPEKDTNRILEVSGNDEEVKSQVASWEHLSVQWKCFISNIGIIL